jgi:tetratricopeptide (TPR) repeat protein
MPYALAIVTALLLFGGQAVSDVRRLYDAGKFNEVISTVEQTRAAADTATMQLQYLAAQSREKLNDHDGARVLYQLLADGADPAWAAIGRAAVALIDKRMDDALNAANSGAEAGALLPEAHFERGIVLMNRRDYEGASAAFDQAIQLDPTFAAAQYNGGLAEYRIKRVDRMAAHFEAFLKLAPNAPERPEVESIMRTVRGRQH